MTGEIYASSLNESPVKLPAGPASIADQYSTYRTHAVAKCVSAITAKIKEKLGNQYCTDTSTIISP